MFGKQCEHQFGMHIFSLVFLVLLKYSIVDCDARGAQLIILFLL
jgi:hypothetical protein